MKLTPLEIKQKKFRSVFRGCHVAEVEEFLQLVSEEMEELVRDNNELKAKMQGLEEQLEMFQSREKTLKETLFTAQKMADDVKVLAERESRSILSAAELEGERLIHEAVGRRETLVSEIHDLKRQRVQFESTLRNSVEIHLKMLDALHDQEYEKPADEKHSFLKQRSTETTSESADADEPLVEEK